MWLVFEANHTKRSTTQGVITMAIVTQRAHAPIIKPTFIDNEANREILQAKISDALKNAQTGGRVSSSFFAQIFAEIGADWLVTRDFLKQHAKAVSFFHDNWLDKNRIFTALARHLRREMSEFAAFAKVFAEFSITLESLYSITAASKTLDRFGLNRAELLEKIRFTSSATPAHVALILPTIFGFVESLSFYGISPREIDCVDDEMIIIDTDADFWRDCYHFDFDDFYLKLALQNDYNEGLSVEIESSLFHFTGVEFVQSDDGSSLQIFQKLQDLLKFAMRGNSLAMLEVLRSAERGIAHA
jgi:hypothetical protein